MKIIYPSAGKINHDEYVHETVSETESDSHFF